jgi:stearoyl-CoA desaturase (delta-9 desaturase)
MSLWEYTRSRGEAMPVQIAASMAAVGYLIWADMNLQWLWVTLGIIAFSNIALVESYLHRYCTHRSYRLSGWMEKTLAFLSAVVPGTGSPIGWVAVHTAHHRHSDTEKDPHSCHHSSFWDLATWKYPYTGTMKSSRAMFKQRHHILLHRYYFIAMALWAVMVTSVLGVYGLIFAVLLPWGFAPLLSTVQNYFLHYDLPGCYRNYETPEHSQNSPWMHVLSFGACGLHNNHHGNMRAWNTREKWWEIDTSAWFIRLVSLKPTGK